jgi:hypothetical protein
MQWLRGHDGGTSSGIECKYTSFRLNFWLFSFVKDMTRVMMSVLP